MEYRSKIIRIYQNSFRVNRYTRDPFRMIGLIDVVIRYPYGDERVTLAFYRSSGSNSGKIQGLWYPIVGIKLHSGTFTEFTTYINHVLIETTKDGYAEEGWLIKSLFFSGDKNDVPLRGFSNGMYRDSLIKVSKKLRYLYENHIYNYVEEMDATFLNTMVTQNYRYNNNSRTQLENYEQYIHNVFIGVYKS